MDSLLLGLTLTTQRGQRKWLRDELGERVHFWPFDGWVPPEGNAAIAEVYPSIFRNRCPREGRSTDEQDAYASARWMGEMAARGALADCFAPPLSPAERAVAAREGWILGGRIEAASRDSGGLIVSIVLPR